MAKRETYTGPAPGSPQQAMQGPPRSSIEAQRAGLELMTLASRRSPIPMVSIPSEGPTRRVYPLEE
jgi:hypothetical protein